MAIVFGSANIPERPGRELYPVIEVVGHLHRPEGIDPGKYPIRVIFNQDDLDDTLDRSRLVTKIIYLEDPDQAIPFRMPKDQVPVLTLSPTEPPLTVARALGRPVAIVRMGVRQPTVEEIQAGPGGDVGLDWAASIGSGPCPFLTSGGTKCGLPCGPVCTAPAPPKQPILPRDEYLCDGGDRGTAAAIGSERTGWAASTLATRSSASTSASKDASSRESCRPTSSASTHHGSPRCA